MRGTSAAAEWSHTCKPILEPGSTREVEIDAAQLAPFVTWGTNPGMVAPVTGEVPDPDCVATDSERNSLARALEYMGLKPAHAH